MKHVYPPRHPAWLDAKPAEPASAPQGQVPAPARPVRATDDSERGATDAVRDGKLPRERGPGTPPR